MFNSAAEDWRVLAFTNGAVFSSDLGPAGFDEEFGNAPSGAGSIFATNPGATVGARFSTPGAYLGDLSAFKGGSVYGDAREQRLISNAQHCVVPGHTRLPGSSQ